MESVKDVIKLKIPARGEYLSLIRLTASSIAAKMGFNIDDIDDVKVSVGEACTSIIESLNPKEESEFKIEYVVSEDSLDIEIKSKVRSEREETEEIDEDAMELASLLEDGLGIMIIQSLMDDVDISKSEEGEMEIKMTKSKKDE
ncbi:serine-protein kinase RsbW [Andreesenia angusta]|uniref:Serine-protein kinase RsbW n=1 Tax=Andreesenia angusta TaxID=39480 RepID=A0A1S1V3V6_9FIRM|nr:ATP-binding protein [Andreesenia angusta]OHW61292.1 serine-protein kinase RsbW [Andreesenia angusta]